MVKQYKSLHNGAFKVDFWMETEIMENWKIVSFNFKEHFRIIKSQGKENSNLKMEIIISGAYWKEKCMVTGN